LLIISRGIEGLNLHYVGTENLHHASAVAVMCVSFWLEAGAYNAFIAKLREGGVNLQEKWLRMLKFQVRRVEYQGRVQRRAALGGLEKRLLCSVLEEAKREGESDLFCACFGRGISGHHPEYATIKDPEGPFLEHGSFFAYCLSLHSMETF
jgi:hypothetical protein